MDHEIRSFGFEVRSLDESTGEFTGYATMFGNIIPWFNERVVAGAFKKTLKENGGKVPILYNHYDWVGMGQAAEEDDKGLFVTGKLAIDKVRLAGETWALMDMAQEVKRPTGLSIGFRSIKDKLNDADGVRDLLEVQLWEYSVTPFPANDKARIVDMRSALDSLTRRRFITAETRDLALAQLQAADEGIEPDAAKLHSILESLRAINQRAA